MTRTLAFLAACGCLATNSVAAEPRDVDIKPLSPGVWRFEVRTNQDGQVVPANGLLISTADGPVLVDPGWRDDQAAALLDFASRTLHHLPVLVVVTHSHRDRAGGLGEVRRRGIRVAWLRRTAELLHDVEPGDLLFTESARVSGLELFFPGPGHSPDNIVVWHAASGTLYGGCFIRAADDGIGWLKEADLEAWPGAANAVARRYPRVKTVVPGHGPPGGPELLVHTAALARAERERQ